MRVLMVCNELPPATHGGIGIATVQLATGLSDAGHSVMITGLGTVAAKFVGDERVTRDLIDPSSPPHCGWAWNRLRLSAKISRLAREQRCDIVEIPDFGAPAPFAVRSKVPRVLRLHGADFILNAASPGAGELTRYLERRTLRRVRHWIAPTQSILDDVKAATDVRPLSAAVVPNPIATSFFSPDPRLRSKTPRILYLGTLSERKGALDLAGAANGILKVFPDARIVFAGRDAPGRCGAMMTDRMVGLIANRYRGRVEFLGDIDRPSIALELRRAWVMAMPSSAESFGLTWAEAMSAGCAVVASDTPVAREVVPSTAGVHVPSGSVVKLTDAILDLLGNPQHVCRLGTAGRQYAVKRYGMSAVAAQNVAAYEAVLATEKRSHR